MTLRERVWRLVPAVFFMSAFNEPSNQRVESDRYVGARHRLYSRSGSKRTELWVGARKRWLSRAVVPVSLWRVSDATQQVGKARV